MNRLQIIPSKFFDYYNKNQPISLLKHFNKLKSKKLDYGYAVSLSAVSSSQIEGNTLDIDTYLKYDTIGVNTNTKSFREIKYLEEAYQFARNHAPNLKNLLHAHYLLSDPDVFEEKYRGKYRDVNVYVGSHHVRLYSAPDHAIISAEMDKLFHDISLLRKRKLTISQTFYYASFIHLIFAKIHPFIDGNGRAARLLEKWFLVNMLGDRAWNIKSEKLYMRRRKSYYQNMVKIGKDYAKLNYSYSFQFLKMLPMALRIK